MEFQRLLRCASTNEAGHGWPCRSELWHRRMTPSIAAPSGSKARLFEHRDVRVRAGPLGARCDGKSSQPDVGETVMPVPMALVTFPERKVTRAVGRRGKDMDVVQRCTGKSLGPGFRRDDEPNKNGRLAAPVLFLRFKLAAHRAAARSLFGDHMHLHRALDVRVQRDVHFVVAEVAQRTFAEDHFTLLELQTLRAEGLRDLARADRAVQLA